MDKNQGGSDYYMQAGGATPEGQAFEEAEVEAQGSVLAVSSGKSVVLLAGIVIGCLIFLYYMFFSGEEVTEEQEIVRPQPVIDIEQAVDVTRDEQGGFQPLVPAIPDLPEPPELVTPTPPPPPAPVIEEPEVVEPPTIAPPTVTVSQKTKRGKSEERIKSSILISGGDGGSGEGEGVLDLFSRRGKDDFLLKRTEFEQARATTVGDTAFTIVQGKVIDAILETAINTDLPGLLRAIVSRDVYAESGKAVLIPKGSRLVGEYESEVKRGQVRVLVIWNRVIRPDGIDIAIESPGIDQLGRAGVSGKVDNHYLEIFGNSILLSTITTAAAFALENVTDSQGISIKENSAGNDTTSGKPSDFAVRDSVENISNISKDLLGNVVETKPTITVDQGTRIKVFVNRDLVFPRSVANSIRVVN